MKKYPLYEHPDITNFKQLVTMQAEHIPEHTAFQYLKSGDVVSSTYKQFCQDIAALEAFFYQQGLRDAKIAILGENSYEWIVAYFAIVLGSNVVVPLDRELCGNEIDKLLSYCDAETLVYSDSYADIAEELHGAHRIQNMYNINQFVSYMKEGRKLIDSGSHDFRQNPVNENSMCSIIFTSGTTGNSKGVMLSQKNLIRNAVDSCRNVCFTGNSLLVLPLHHTFAFTAGVLMMLIYGAPICISRGLRTFNTDMQIFKPHHMFLVPLYVETMYNAMRKEVQGRGESGSPYPALKQFGGELELIISGGAPIDQKYIDGMNAIGIQVLNGYGITECSPVVAVNRNKYYRKNSVGIPLSCCDIKIEKGEICVKGDNVMLGYYRDEAATQEVLRDGWFHTGDMGYLDEEGFLYITGRKKNLIILSNGENVSAEEMENRIQEIKNVDEVIVYADGGEITAEIYAENQDGVREAVNELNRQLPMYKRIQKVKFRNAEFEKTTTKKIKRIIQDK